MAETKPSTGIRSDGVEADKENVAIKATDSGEQSDSNGQTAITRSASPLQRRRDVAAKVNEQQAEREAMLREADGHFVAKRLLKAKELYKQALSRFGPGTIILIRLADICVMTGELDEAAHYILRLRNHAPEFEWTPMVEADLAIARSETERAIELLEEALVRMPGFATAEQRLKTLKRKIELERHETSRVELQTWPAAGDAAFLSAAPEDRVLVASWEISHNVAGRGITMAETICGEVPTAMAGPMVPQHRGELWPPLARSDRKVPIIGWHAPTFRHLVEGALLLARQWPAKTVWVSKPRFPGMLIGLVYRYIHDARLLCDVDDDELAFVGGDAPIDFDTFLDEFGREDWQLPQGKIWTELGLGMLPWVDGVTACNPVLSRRHGATLVRHGRSKQDAEAAIDRRSATREEFGFTPQDKIVMFLGTPRRHKGLIEIAKAVVALDDPNAILCVAGTVVDPELEKALKNMEGLRLVRLGAQPFARVLDLNAMADAVVLLQDEKSRIAQSQTPAKLTDAVAVGTSLLVTNVPPVSDVIEAGAAMAVSKDAGLIASLRKALDSKKKPQGNRDFFFEEMAYEPNCTRALAAIETTRRVLPKEYPDTRRLFEFIDREMPGTLPDDLTSLCAPYLSSNYRVSWTIDPHKPLNIVFFWKQNDSSIYGRRQDMLLRELSRRAEVGRILHIDAPIDISRLYFQPNPMRNVLDDESQLITANTLMRLSGQADEGNVHRRAFVTGREDDRLFGQKLPGPESFPAAVETWMRQLDMTDNCIAWVCPVVEAFPDVQRRIGFPFIVSDYIDDQRRWPNSPAKQRAIEKNYRFMAENSGLAIANCELVAQELREQGLSPLLVPNGIDVISRPPRVAAEIAGLEGPVVGYCGNMNDRFDFDLVESLAHARPDVQIALIGKLTRQPELNRMKAIPNVHVLGVRRYEEAQACIAGFDVAIIPHKRNSLSDRMNPLKLYVYRALGIPVVSSEIANLDDFSGDVLIARGANDFIEGIGRILQERNAPDEQVLPDDLRNSLTWETRMDVILSGLKRELASRFEH